MYSATAVPHPELAVHPASRLTPTGRIAAAGTLLLGTGLQAAGWLVYAKPDPFATYSALAAGDGRPDLALTLIVLSVPFWIASVPVYVLLGRERSPRLAWTGGALLIAGLTALATNLGTEVLTSALVRNGAIDPAQATQAATTLESLPATVTNLLFIVGVGLGIPLIAVSLWRSHTIPRTAAALLVTFLVMDIVGQGTATAAWAVLAHLIAVVAASWIAVAVVRAQHRTA